MVKSFATLTRTCKPLRVLHAAYGTEGELNLEEELWGEVFEPLRNRAQFMGFRVDAGLQTLTWPNGADLAPEFIYRSVSAQRGAELDP